MSTPNYEIDPNDPKLKAVDTEKNTALSQSNNAYDEMISNSDQFYKAQIDASKQWADKQTQLQQENTDFAIQKIEQQKEQTQKDYNREQSAAYVDYQKQTNQYGANAEQMAAQGMGGTGYSESAKVSMFNAYQNRVATARESYNTAILNYNNAITEARLQNNSALAEIAYNALQKQLELSLQGFQYKNTLLSEKANKELAIKQMYDNKWQNVWSQIMEENKLKENVRQYESSLAFQKEQLAEEKRQFDKLHEDSGSVSISSSRGSSKNYAKSSSSSNSKKLSNKSLSKQIEGNTSGKSYENILSKMPGAFTSQKQAENFLKTYGISSGGQRILSSLEWSKGKRMGDNSSEFEYSSYPAYLTAYVTWRVKQSAS